MKENQKSCKVDIVKFLQDVDALFPIPLSHKQSLEDLAEKIWKHATLCTVCEKDGCIVGMVAGYTNNDPAYISIVATFPKIQGKGFAERLVKEFINIARSKGISAVHLYAVPGNLPAMRLYEKLHFVPYIIENEPRPDDAHLIYYIEKN